MKSRWQGRDKGSALVMEDIARLAGVHSSTVSRALDPDKMSLLSPETRARVQAIAAELGFRPQAAAQSLRRGRSASIGIVVAELANPFISVVLDGIASVLDRGGFTALIAQTREEPGALGLILENLRRWRVDAVITTAARRSDSEVLWRFNEAVPIVLAVRTVADRSLPSVTHDDARGGQLAAEYFADLGHAVVGQLCGPSDVSSFAQRRAGFVGAAEALGLGTVDLPKCAGHPNAVEGNRLMELLLRGKRRPTAVFAHNDSMAVGAIDAIRRAGLNCPRDVSILGYNDAPLSDHLFPPLSTIRFPGEAVGRQAAELAISRSSGRKDAPPPSVSFPPELIARGSSGPPPVGQRTRSGRARLVPASEHRGTQSKSARLRADNNSGH